MGAEDSTASKIPYRAGLPIKDGNKNLVFCKKQNLAFGGYREGRSSIAQLIKTISEKSFRNNLTLVEHSQRECRLFWPIESDVKYKWPFGFYFSKTKRNN